MENWCVIMCGNRFVSKPGSNSSYTNNLANARIYRTYACAMRDVTMNECIMYLSKLLYVDEE